MGVGGVTWGEGGVAWGGYVGGGVREGYVRNCSLVEKCRFGHFLVTTYWPLQSYYILVAAG